MQLCHATRWSAIGCLVVGSLIPQSVDACTGFVFAKGDRVFAGNNEDYWNTNTRMWFVPAEGATHGRVYFGFDNGFPQGGMNDQGLFFDGFATAPNKIENSLEKPNFSGLLIDEAMSKCANVQEVIELFEKYNLASLEKAMLFFADRTGDAVIVEGDEFLRKNGPFQVVTNFYQSKVASGPKPCERYNIAHGMLSAAEEPSVELCRRILAATHAEGKAVTLYSNVYDLTKGLVYLYHFHNFENVVVINLEEELSKGAHRVDISSLFPRTYAAEHFRQLQRQEVERKKEKRRLTAGVPRSTLDEYVGRYKLLIEPVGERIVQFDRETDKLFGSTAESHRFELVPESTTSFFYISENGEVTIRFQRDAEGNVSSIVCEQDGKTYTGRRIE